MSEATFTRSDDTAAPARVEVPTLAERRAALRERGMATIEYALGVIVVVVIVGVVIAAIQTGTFQQLVEQLIRAIMSWVELAFKIALPFPKP